MSAPNISYVKFKRGVWIAYDGMDFFTMLQRIGKQKIIFHSTEFKTKFIVSKS